MRQKERQRGWLNSERGSEPQRVRTRRTWTGKTAGPGPPGCRGSPLPVTCSPFPAASSSGRFADLAYHTLASFSPIRPPFAPTQISLPRTSDRALWGSDSGRYPLVGLATSGVLSDASWCLVRALFSVLCAHHRLPPACQHTHCVTRTLFPRGNLHPPPSGVKVAEATCAAKPSQSPALTALLHPNVPANPPCQRSGGKEPYDDRCGPYVAHTTQERNQWAF